MGGFRINHIKRKNEIKNENKYKIILRITNPFFKMIKKYEIVNRELLPPEDGLILVFNHRDYWDIPLIFSILNTRPVYPLIKIEFKKQLAGKILEFMGAIFVDREIDKERARSKEKLLELVLNGRNVLIAPEGTRNKTNAPLLPFTNYGAVSIAQKTGCPIVPFAISRCGKKGKKRLVQICAPLFVNINDNLEEANEKLYGCLYNVLGKNDLDTDSIKNKEGITYAHRYWRGRRVR